MSSCLIDFNLLGWEQERTRAFVKGGAQFWGPPPWQQYAPPLKTPFLKKY